MGQFLHPAIWILHSFFLISQARLIHDNTEKMMSYWHPCKQVGDLAYALVVQWKRLCMAYSPPREEPVGQFLSDISYSEEEEMEEVVAVPPGGDSPTDSSDEFEFNI